MFSFRPSRFGGGEDPWFRIGTFDIGSAGVVAVGILVGVVVWAAEGPGHWVTTKLAYSYDGVRGGELWRLFTWFLQFGVSSNQLLWGILAAVMVYLFGSQLEGAAGKIRMAKFLVVLILIPSFLALALNLAGLGGFRPLTSSLLSSALFYSYVAHMPTAKFWFGIPGWVFAAGYFVLEALAEIGDRNLGGLLFLFGRIGLWLLAAKAFGLADDAHWIPDPRPAAVRSGGGSGGSTGVSRPKGRSKRSKADLSVVPPQVDNFDEMGIDAILDQVSANGVDSLSSAQKKKLKEYSKQRKKRG